MLDRKYRQSYMMSFLAFERLVAELTPSLRPTTQMFVRPPISIKKQVCLVVYRLAHDFFCKTMNMLYGCGKSIIRKYTLIVCRVLSSRTGLFGAYIHASRGHRLMDIIHKFRDLTSLPNVVGAIDGTHIPLSTKPQGDLTPILCDFFNWKKFIVYYCKQYAMQRVFFEMCMEGNPVECMMLLSLFSQ